MTWTTAMYLSPAVVILGCVGIAWRQARLRRRQHVTAAKGLDDEAFVEQMGVPVEQRAYCLAIRRAMARAAGVPTETIHPDIPMTSLCRLGFDGIDLTEVVMEIESEFNVHIGDHLAEDVYGGHDPMGITFAEFARCVLNMLVQLTPPVKR